MRDKAIRTIHPTVTTINAGTEAWDKDGNVVELDESKIAVEFARLQAEYDAQEYARNRATEYPAIADQLDEIFHNGLDSWRAIIQQTKDKYSKG